MINPKKIDRVAFGEYLKDFLHQNKLTQKAFAKKTCIIQSIITGLVNAKYALSYENMNKMLEVFPDMDFDKFELKKASENTEDIAQKSKFMMTPQEHIAILEERLKEKDDMLKQKDKVIDILVNAVNGNGSTLLGAFGV